MMNDEHAKQSTDLNSGQNMSREGDLHGGTLSSSNPAFRNLALKGLKGNIVPEEKVAQDAEESAGTIVTIKEELEGSTLKAKLLTEKATKEKPSKTKSSKGKSTKEKTSKEKTSKGKASKRKVIKEMGMKEKISKKKRSENKPHRKKKSPTGKISKDKVRRGKTAKIDRSIVQKNKSKGLQIADENLSSFSHWLHELAPVGHAALGKAYETTGADHDELTKDASKKTKSRKGKLDKVKTKKNESPKAKLAKAKTKKTESAKAKLTKAKTKKVKSSKGKSSKNKKKKKQRDKGVVLSNDVFSETLADLLAAQGHKTQAIHMYEKMRLIYPEKSRFFAAKIEELNKKE